jgi:hypothetical protein
MSFSGAWFSYRSRDLGLGPRWEPDYLVWKKWRDRYEVWMTPIGAP